MAKPDRLEDLGRIGSIVESIIDEGLLDPIDISENEFVRIYTDINELEILYNKLGSLLRYINRIDRIANGDPE